MKDKENQIKSDCEKCIHDKVCYDCLMTDKCWGKDNNCKHYQPKLPEDSVVLSKEEYEELQVGKDFNYGYHNGENNMTAYYENIRLPEVRKETAEKIFNTLLNCHGHFSKEHAGEYSFSLDKDRQYRFVSKAFICELAKQFSVEIKE